MYWLSVISSITGIVTFVISFFEYFKKWRVYLQYAGFLTAGLTVGVVLSMSEKTVQQFTQSQLIYLISLVSIVALIILFIYRYLNNSRDPFFVVIIILGLLGYFSIRLLNSVDSSLSFIKPNDYLIISNYCIKTGDYTRAADYLKRYRELQTANLSGVVLDSLDKKVESLYQKGIREMK